MRDAKQVFDEIYAEMRWRTLSLAADLDRVDRGTGGLAALGDDARLAKLRAAIELLRSPEHGRAERVQHIFSDKTPPPAPAAITLAPPPGGRKKSGTAIVE